jgi:hypothetical protein
MRQINWKKYLLVLVLTIVVFMTAFFLSDFLNSKKMDQIKDVGDKMFIDILASEVQYSLLAESSCEDVDNSILSKELNSLATRLEYMEKQLGTDNSEVQGLKKYYSLLEIKDYLLLKKISEKCKFPPTFVLYFYSNEGDCDDCQRAGYALTYLREEYPQLKIYSFDYNLDLPAVKTLIALYKIKNDLPAMIMGGQVYYDLNVREEIEAFLPGVDMGNATSTKNAEDIDES